LIKLDARIRTGAVSMAPDDERLAYLHKLSGLLQTPFGRTLYLDCDVLVIAPNFAHDLLTRALRVADVAMPLDPGRAAHLVPHERDGGAPANIPQQADAQQPLQQGASPTRHGPAAHSAPRGGAAPRVAPWARAPWVAPSVGPPMLCSAVLAYQRNAASDELFVGAARRLLSRRHPGVRQGDQEMLWFQWQSGEGARAHELRVLALPEETYCPLERRQRPRLPEWNRTTWHTSWRRGVYPCAAVHGHAYLAHATHHE
jgi:hypothetical protein